MVCGHKCPFSLMAMTKIIFFGGWSYSHLELPPSGHRPQCRVPLAEMMLGPGHPEATTCCIGDPFFVDKSRWNKSKAYTINKCVHIYIYIHSCIQTVYTSGVYTCMCIYIYVYYKYIHILHFSTKKLEGLMQWTSVHIPTSDFNWSTTGMSLSNVVIPKGQKPMFLWNHQVPSGKRLHNYGKPQLSMGKSTISMAIFNSYVKLPEGSHKKLYRTIKNTKKVIHGESGI